MSLQARGSTTNAELILWAQKLFARLYPEYLRVGPWHPVARASLAALLLALAASRRRAFEAADSQASDDRGKPLLTSKALRAFRAAGALWGCSLLASSLWHEGWWPMVSYTMQSWTLMTTRYVLGTLELHDAGSSPSSGRWRQAVSRFNEALRFPSLVQNSITVVVWWTVLVPIILALYGKDARRRAAFQKFNMSFALLNFHGMNLPLAAADHLLSPRRLLPSDLWLAIASATAYVLFYLSVLDSRGLHLYIILSPRTKFSAVSTGSILACYFALHRLWDRAARSALEFQRQPSASVAGPASRA
mmetsp:Transcript_99205/g.309203  ORF Transcript_99205/g.309203 Transcript_99205/m.309203 type:complete len:304 (+) Transcript_99205:112-1023(+)